MARKKEIITEAAASETKKKPGRKPMTEAEKEAAAKVRAAEKAKADSLKPAFVMQFQESEVDLSELAETAKAEFRQTRKRTLITDMKLYIKPEEHTAYYVINETHTGSIPF